MLGHKRTCLGDRQVLCNAKLWSKVALCAALCDYQLINYGAETKDRTTRDGSRVLTEYLCKVARTAAPNGSRVAALE